MIALPIRVLILLILPTITSTSQPAVKTHSSLQSHIDWSICGHDDNEARCYCANDAGELISEKNIPKAIAEKTEQENIGKCNIGIQSKYYNERGAFIHLQVIDSSKALGTDPQLAVYQDTIMLFGCKFDSKTETIQLQVDTLTQQKYRIELIEELSYFNTSGTVCALNVGKAFKMYSSIKNVVPKKIPIMKFTAAQTVEYKDISFDFFSITNGFTKCDSYAFKDQKDPVNYRVRDVPNRYGNTLDCSAHGPSYKMRYQDDEGRDDEMIKLTCVKSDEWSYEITMKDPEGNLITKDVDDPTLYTFYCAADFSEVCKNPEVNCKDNPSSQCPKYEKGGPGKSAKLTCPFKKWLIDGKYYELANDPVCKQDVNSNRNAAAFYTTFPSGLPRKTLGARCFTEYDCTIKSKHHTVPCNDEKCVKVDDSNGILKCTDEKRKLKIHDYTRNTTIFATKYTCDTNNGKWTNDTGGTIEDNSQVSCVGDAPAASGSTASAKLSPPLVYTITALTYIAILSLAFGGVVFGIKRYNKRKYRGLVDMKDKKGWKEQKKDARIKFCKNIFEDVLEATPLPDSLRITHGLDLLALMLNTETEDAEAWEQAYPFLMRFQGTIMKVDRRIWKMFSRYMYLEAKKIVDKHGWRSPKRITNKQKKGLLRVVAIHLLTFALYDPGSADAEKFIVEGFRKLGFRAIKQYPHCGVLWSVLLHAGPHRYRFPGANHDKLFMPKQFMDTLHLLAFKGKKTIPAADIIPEFGSVAKQAAFALGGSPNYSYHGKNARKIMANKLLKTDEGKELALPYFEGMCMSAIRNPVPAIINALHIWPKADADFVVDMHKAAPENAWNEQIERTCKLVTYYGRHNDAKRLHERLMPKKSEEEHAKAEAELSLEQKQFEQTFNQQLEEVRAWFAERTDIESLKKKPEYEADMAKYLDDDGGGAPGAETDAVAPEAVAGAPNLHPAVPACGSSSASSSAAPTPKDVAATPIAAVPTPNTVVPAPDAAAPPAAAPAAP